jgi:D-sedoheptulose 7-phosphate isomerase
MTTWIDADLDDYLETARSAKPLLSTLREVGQMLCDAFSHGAILYSFGNGGSACDAQHFTGEIIGHYKRDRRPLGAVTIGTDPATFTCIANDFSYDDVFARQVTALARHGDVIAAFSTSGRSENVVQGLQAAHERGATTILFGGGDGGPAAEYADWVLLSPSASTPRVQEFHTFMLHELSEMVDAWAASEDLA